jgi:ABC-type Fe3+ transport system permease subunit
MRVPFSPSRIWIEFGPELTGALTVAGITSAIALFLAFLSATRWTRFSLILFALTFLLGGQLLAIALIRIWNHPHLTWAYNAFPVPVIAYLARFGWLALASARGTWSPHWQELRSMSALDGATPTQTALHIIYPLAWPTLLSASLLIGALSMTEVPATVLLQPSNPNVLTPMLMSWVHMARYDPMIEASLLMILAITIPWLLVVLLTAIAKRR